MSKTSRRRIISLLKRTIFCAVYGKKPTEQDWIFWNAAEFAQLLGLYSTKTYTGDIVWSMFGKRIFKQELKEREEMDEKTLLSYSLKVAFDKYRRVRSGDTAQVILDLIQKVTELEKPKEIPDFGCLEDVQIDLSDLPIFEIKEVKIKAQKHLMNYPGAIKQLFLLRNQKRQLEEAQKVLRQKINEVLISVLEKEDD